MQTIWKESYVLTKLPLIYKLTHKDSHHLAAWGIGLIAVGLFMMLVAGFLLFQYTAVAMFFAVLLFALSLWLLKTGQLLCSAKQNQVTRGLWEICADGQYLSLIFWHLNSFGDKTEQRLDIRGIRYIEFPENASRLLSSMPIDLNIKTSRGAVSLVFNPNERSGFNKLLKYLRQHSHIHFYAV